MRRRRTPRTLLPSLLLALAIAVPTSAHAQDDSDRETADALTTAGLTVFVSTYALTGLAATTLVLVANAREATIAESWIPVVGPWIMLGDSAGFNSLQIGLTIGSGVLQLASLTALIVGLVLDAQVPDDAPEDVDRAALRLEPIASPDGAGLRLLGRF